MELRGKTVDQALAKAGLPLDSNFDEPAREKTLSNIFDEAWAKTLMRQAALRQRDNARGDERARKRVELLRMRFQDNRPIREIAQKWGVEADFLHHEYATARDEFREALRAVVAEHQPGSPGEIERECQRLIDCFP